jgi:hypothetical protein
MEDQLPKTDMQKLYVAITATCSAATKKFLEANEATESGNGFMLTATMQAAYLTEKQWTACKIVMKQGKVSQGTINKLSRFMSPNAGNKELHKVLKGSDKASVDAMIVHLNDNHKIDSFRKLEKQCLQKTQDEKKSNLVTQLANMPKSEFDETMKRVNELRREAALIEGQAKAADEASVR